MTPDRIKQKPHIIAVDFDGVVHQYSKGWHDGTIYDPPIHGIKELLQDLKDKGCEILIYTTRAFDRIVNGEISENQLTELHEYFRKFEIPYDSIWTGHGKPLAHIYLDDRAVRFKNVNQARGHIFEILELY